MEKTKNLQLNKPDAEDFYNIDDFNQNSEIIDEAIEEQKKSHADHIADKVSHITSSERKNWNSKAAGDHTHTKSEITDFPSSLKNPNALSINGKTYDGSSATDVGVMSASYGGTGKTSLIDSSNALINALSTGSDTPVDADYYVSQYVNGGTKTTTYHRRPMSALWNYIKSKLSTVATTGSYSDLKNKPNYAGSSSAGGAATSANKLNTNAGSATNPIYFADGIPKACSYSLNKTVPSNAVFTDTNTWRGIQNNLTSTSTTDSLSAYQGKLLNDKITALQNSGKVYVVNHAKGTSTTISWSSLIGGGLKGSCDIFLIVARSWATAKKTATVACISFITSNYINIDILCGGTSPAPTISYTADTSITINWCDSNGGGFSIYRIV